MYPTAELCRAQQAYHRERAETSLLENVRIVSNKAAKAWGTEAEEAERREARRAQTRLTAHMIASQRRTAGTEMLRALNENPDRGLSVERTILMTASRP